MNGRRCTFLLVIQSVVSRWLILRVVLLLVCVVLLWWWWFRFVGVSFLVLQQQHQSRRSIMSEELLHLIYLCQKNIPRDFIFVDDEDLYLWSFFFFTVDHAINTCSIWIIYYCRTYIIIKYYQKKIFLWFFLIWHVERETRDNFQFCWCWVSWDPHKNTERNHDEAERVHIIANHAEKYIIAVILIPNILKNIQFHLKRE